MPFDGAFQAAGSKVKILTVVDPRPLPLSRLKRMLDENKHTREAFPKNKVAIKSQARVITL
jgi:hypothetical protein